MGEARWLRKGFARGRLPAANAESCRLWDTRSPCASRSSSDIQVSPEMVQGRCPVKLRVERRQAL